MIVRQKDMNIIDDEILDAYSINDEDYDLDYSDIVDATLAGDLNAFDDEFMEYEDVDVPNGLLKKKTRNKGKKIKTNEFGWGKILLDPELNNSLSKQAKKFRRTFRVTYPLFLYIVDECKKVNLLSLLHI